MGLEPLSSPQLTFRSHRMTTLEKILSTRRANGPDAWKGHSLAPFLLSHCKLHPRSPANLQFARLGSHKIAQMAGLRC